MHLLGIFDLASIWQQLRFAKNAPPYHPSRSFPALTAARGLAAWWVVLYHFKEEMPTEIAGTNVGRLIAHGNLAVDFFFELSGFIIALNYAERLTRTTWPQYRNFICTRIARIYPLHLALLISFVTNLIAIQFWSSSKTTGPRYDLSYFLLSVLMVQNWGFTKTLAWNIPAWSISTEWAAYLLFPLYTYLMTRVANTTLRAGFFVVGLLMLLAVCCYFFGHSLGSDIARFGLVRCLLEFGAGVALERLWESHSRWKSWHGWLATAGAVALTTIYGEGLAPDFVSMPFSFVMIIFLLTTNIYIVNIIANPLLLYMGEISYSTYMVHYFIKDWVKFIFVYPRVSPLIPITIYTVSVIIASMILYHFLEVPARHAIRARLTRRPFAAQNVPTA